MKFIFTINRMKAGSGGAQKVVSLLCNSIAEKNHDVLLILYEDRTDMDYYISDKVSISVLPKRNAGENILRYALRKLLYLRKSVFSFNPDIIVPFLADQTFYIFLATLFSKFNTRIITTVRNNPKLFPKQKKYRWRNNVLIALSKAVFFQNDEQKKYFPLFIQKKSFVLPNPVSDELLFSVREKLDLNKLVTLGRLNDQKNQMMLIEAISTIKTKFPDISLDIYGEGELEAKLEAKIIELKLEKNVHLCGITNDVKSVLLSHGLFVMTSNYEGMPNALIEAMATGMPCISTDCPTGPSDLIKNYQNGLLVPMHDIKKCASAIEYMIDNKERAISMGLQAQIDIREKLACETISRRFISNCKVFIMDRK